MAQLTSEMANAARWRGKQLVEQIPVLFGHFDDGDDTGRVVILGAGATPEMVLTAIPYTNRTFEVSCALLTVGEAEAAQLQKVASHLRAKEWADKQIRPYKQRNPARR